MSEESTNTDSSDDERSSLRTGLDNGWCKSMFATPPHKFIPEGLVERLVDLEAVKRTLNIDQPSSKEQLLIDFILSRARRAFAVAVSARIKDVKKAMKWFKNKEIDDTQLPIKTQSSDWETGWRGYFYDEQWKFFAAVFLTTSSSHDFEEARILPFTSMSPVSDEGAFGEVFRVVVHRDHIKPEFLNHGEFAVKKIKAQTDTEEVAEHWEREVKALRMMNELNQKHIVRFITAFRRLKENGEEHYVMFEWANGGNLRHLWKATPLPELTGALMKVVIEQLLGLAEALKAAHNLQSPGSVGASYRHGDLKPENILVFSSENTNEDLIGTLKIGDWGEAKYQGKVTAIRPSRTTTKFGTRRYEAPEVEIGVKATYLGQSTKRRSRLGDVWAMGCITLEFIVWLLYGLKGLDQFNHDVFGETFYQISIVNGKKVARVHSAAVRWMEQMAEEKVCELGSTALGDLLEFVRSQLLVVDLPQSLGSPRSDLDLEWQRNNFFDDLSSSSAQTTAALDPPDIDSLSIFEEPAIADNPSFTLTIAETNEETDGALPPVQLDSEIHGPIRCHASIFWNKLHNINSKERLSYWETEKLQLQAPVDLENAENIRAFDQTILPLDEYRRGDYASPELDENQWKLSLDNDSAVKMFKALQEFQESKPPSQCVPPICDECMEFRAELRVAGFWKSYEVEDLRARSRIGRCELCKLLWLACEKSESLAQSTVRFDRDRAFLKVNGVHKASLSLVRSPATGVPQTSDCQIGFVELPPAGSRVHLQLIKYWLQECDKVHSCRPHTFSDGPNGRPKTRMPKRLLDVGLSRENTIFLRESSPLDSDEWIALSHRWGQRNFSTTRRNLPQLINHGLKVADLPTTFKDAVTITRALGKRYLWIDSLCIIQGDDGDFQTEAMRMADVYSGAYCVIAASCASDHYDGFLKPRSRREHVAIEHEGDKYFICENIDNFKKHVLDGALNLRGWVLQEHALARRTVFFTEHQTYFECKDGIRCETSTKLANEFAKFLGDSDFPGHLLKAKRGEKINRIQKLYMDYSRLGFSKPHDRPVAIGGLQQKLIQTIKVSGEFGIVEDPENPGWLRRSLLWRRGSSGLKRIMFPNGGAALKVPSWSWMAFDGGIDYHRPDFGNYDWEDIASPWSPTNIHACMNALVAKAWNYDLEPAGHGESEIVFDDTQTRYSSSGICVILGKAKGVWVQELRRHWVLIIMPVTFPGCKTSFAYERVGTGYIPGRCLRTPHSDSVHIH